MQIIRQLVRVHVVAVITAIQMAADAQIVRYRAPVFQHIIWVHIMSVNQKRIMNAIAIVQHQMLQILLSSVVL